jgi:hypothetical protein
MRKLSAAKRLGLQCMSFSPFQPDGSELAALCMSCQPDGQS